MRHSHDRAAPPGGRVLDNRGPPAWWPRDAYDRQRIDELQLPALLRQAEEWGVLPDDVRLVMGFDS